jgi:hypothetical protein
MTLNIKFNQDEGSSITFMKDDGERIGNQERVQPASPAQIQSWSAPQT